MSRAHVREFNRWTDYVLNTKLTKTADTFVFPSATYHRHSSTSSLSLLESLIDCFSLCKETNALAIVRCCESARLSALRSSRSCCIQDPNILNAILSYLPTTTDHVLLVNLLSRQVFAWENQDLEHYKAGNDHNLSDITQLNKFENGNYKLCAIECRNGNVFIWSDEPTGPFLWTGYGFLAKLNEQVMNNTGVVEKKQTLLHPIVITHFIRIKDGICLRQDNGQWGVLQVEQRLNVAFVATKKCETNGCQQTYSLKCYHWKCEKHCCGYEACCSVHPFKTSNGTSQYHPKLFVREHMDVGHSAKKSWYKGGKGGSRAKNKSGRAHR